MAQTDFSTSDLIKKGWGSTKAHRSVLFKLGIAYALVVVVFNVFHTTAAQQAGLLFLVSILNTLVSTILEIGIIRIALDLVDGKKGDIKDIYQNYNMFLPFFLTSLIYGIIVFVGFILLIVPGIYLAIKYQFTPFVVVDKGTKYWPALKQAGEMTRGRWFQIFLFDLTLVGLNILGALALGIGLLLTIPTSLLASAYLYRKLSA